MEVLNINIPVTDLGSIIPNVADEHQFYATMAYGDVVLVSGRTDLNTGAVNIAVIRINFDTGDACVYQQGIDIRKSAVYTAQPSFLMKLKEGKYLYSINGYVFFLTIPVVFIAGAFLTSNFVPIKLKCNCDPALVETGLYKNLNGGFVATFEYNVPTPLDTFVTVYDDNFNELDYGVANTVGAFYSNAGLLGTYVFGYYTSSLYYNDSLLVVNYSSGFNALFGYGEYATKLKPLNCAAIDPSNELLAINQSVFKQPYPAPSSYSGGYIQMPLAFVGSYAGVNSFAIFANELVVEANLQFGGGQAVPEQIAIRKDGKFLAFQWSGHYVKTFTGQLPQNIIDKILKPVVTTRLSSSLLNWHRPISTRGSFRT